MFNVKCIFSKDNIKSKLEKMTKTKITAKFGYGHRQISENEKFDKHTTNS